MRRPAGTTHRELALDDVRPDTRPALEEAEGAFDEAVAHHVSALAERRHAVRAGWQEEDPESPSAELRLALRQYREITQRLLRT